MLSVKLLGVTFHQKRSLTGGDRRRTDGRQIRLGAITVQHVPLVKPIEPRIRLRISLSHLKIAWPAGIRCKSVYGGVNNARYYSAKVCYSTRVIS